MDNLKGLSEEYVQLYMNNMDITEPEQTYKNGGYYGDDFGNPF